jgi:type I restriction enzyme, S subunit
MCADWATVRLGEVASILTGFPFKSQHYIGDPTAPRLIRGDNIAQGWLRWDGVKRWPNSMASNLDDYWLAPEDIVLAMDRPWIEAGLKYACLSSHDLPALLVQRVARLRGGPRLDIRYLRHLIGSRAFTDYIRGIETGTAVPHISGSQIKGFEFALPPLGTQQAIGAVLGALNDKIYLNRRMNTTIDATTKVIFKDWFVDFGPTRAKIEGREPYLAPEVWALFPERLDGKGKPEGWVIERLGKLTSKIGSGSTPRGGSAVYVEDGVGLIRSQNVYDHEFRWEGLAHISDEEAERLRGVTVMPKDVLINITGDSILRTCVVDDAVLPARVNQHVAIVRTKPGVSSRFLHQYLVRDSSKAHLLGNDAGGSRPAVTKGHLEAFPLVCPPNVLMNAFDRITSAMFDRVSENGTESRTLAETRDLLLPKLMSGEIRIKEAEKAVAELV